MFLHTIIRQNYITVCGDNDDRCEQWAQEGECDNNPEYMLIECRQACKVCEPGPQPTPKPTSHATEPTSTGATEPTPTGSWFEPSTTEAPKPTPTPGKIHIFYTTT